MKLETSNLAHKWMAVSTNGHVGSRDPILKFWDTPNISGTNKARNFKFGTEMDGQQ